MNLSGIISIAGLPGLYKAVAQTKNGLIVESLIDKKRIPTYANHRISSLEEISIYTTGEDRPLKAIFEAIAGKINFEAAIDHKAPEKELVAFFADSVADYDTERVHLSDIRKVIQWYNILQKNDLLKAEEVTEKTEEAAPKVVPVATPEEKKKFSKTAVKDVKAKPSKSHAAKKTSTTRKSGAA